MNLRPMNLVWALFQRLSTHSQLHSSPSEGIRASEAGKTAAENRSLHSERHTSSAELALCAHAQTFASLYPGILKIRIMWEGQRGSD